MYFRIAKPIGWLVLPVALSLIMTFPLKGKESSATTKPQNESTTAFLAVPMSDPNRRLEGVTLLIEYSAIPKKDYSLLIMTTGSHVLSMKTEVTYQGDVIFSGQLPDTATPRGATLTKIRFSKEIATCPSEQPLSGKLVPFDEAKFKLISAVIK